MSLDMDEEKDSKDCIYLKMLGRKRILFESCILHFSLYDTTLFSIKLVAPQVVFSTSSVKFTLL